MTPPETNVSRYTPDKEAMLNALNLFFEELKETNHSKPLYKLCVDIINEFDTWTDIFKALLHAVFKEHCYYSSMHRTISLDNLKSHYSNK